MATTDALDYEVIVIGAGVEGSATAFELSGRGVRTLLLEQFPLPHSRGSSHGQTRVIRKSYPQPIYSHMMEHCVDTWRDVQARTGTTLYKRIGYLALGPVHGPFLRANMASMDSQGQSYQHLSHDQLAKDFPMLNYPSTIGGLLDAEGGILMADKALHALQFLFRAQGGHLKDNEKVIKVTPGQVVRVATSRGAYQCRSVVLCCGPWSGAMLKPLRLQLPLKPIRVSVCYWREKDPGSHSMDKLPTFFEEKCLGGYSIYGLPSEEYPGHVKLCLHGGPEMDPEARDMADVTWIQELLSDYVSKHFPGLESSKPSIVETCIYTNTPDRHLILDHHPEWKNIVIGAGFSGHGFKLAPAVGHILSDLATGRTSPYDLSHFKISRFKDVVKVKDARL